MEKYVQQMKCEISAKWISRELWEERGEKGKRPRGSKSQARRRPPGGADPCLTWDKLGPEFLYEVGGPHFLSIHAILGNIQVKLKMKADFWMLRVEKDVYWICYWPTCVQFVFQIIHTISLKLTKLLLRRSRKEPSGKGPEVTRGTAWD